MICWCCWEKIDVAHDCDTTVTSQSYCSSCTKQVPGRVTAKEGRLKSEFAFFHWSSSRLQPGMSATYLSSSYQQKKMDDYYTLRAEATFSQCEWNASIVLPWCIFSGFGQMPFEVERHNYQPSKPQVQFFLGNSPVCFSFYLFFLLHSVPRNFHMATRNLNRFCKSTLS